MKSFKFITIFLVHFWYSHIAFAAKELALIPQKPEVAALLKNYKTHDGGAILVPSSACAAAMASNIFQKHEFQLYATEEVEAELKKIQPEGAKTDYPTLVTLYKQMIEKGGKRYLISPPALEAIEALKDAHPNFAEVINNLKKEAALYHSAAKPLKTNPILLLGEPGIGKTHFAQSFSKIIGTEFKLIPFSSLTAGWILSGSDKQWKGSKEGYLANRLVHGNYGNPVVVLDEIDKANSEGKNYDPLGSLYSLLEHDTAQVFRDEFLDIAMDTSHVLWVATANNAHLIPEPILNRMDVYVIPAPNKEQAMQIAQIIYKNYLKDLAQLNFAPQLTEEVASLLASVPPRSMKSVIWHAITSANYDKRKKIEVKDIDLSKVGEQNRSIGFH